LVHPEARFRRQRTPELHEGGLLFRNFNIPGGKSAVAHKSPLKKACWEPPEVEDSKKRRSREGKGRVRAVSRRHICGKKNESGKRKPRPKQEGYGVRKREIKIGEKEVR